MNLIEQAYIRDYREMFRKLSWIAWKRIDRIDEAQDIAEEALIKTWENRQNIYSPSDIYRYALSCVRNACANYAARHRRHVDLPDLCETVEDLEQYTEQLESMHKAIVSLPNRKRKVMLMALKGMNNDEIAESMQSTSLTIRQDRFRAITLLRKTLNVLKINHP